MKALAILIALTIHEYAHARAALAQGDDTAKLAGRISLNPLDHLDPVGTILIIIVMVSNLPLIGWGKPVPVNPFRFKSPRWGNLSVSLWGPLSNLILGSILIFILRLVIVPLAPEYLDFVHTCIITNLCIAFFNLIPIPPLDGSHILSSLMPTDMARRYDYAVGRYGMIILMVLIYGGVTRFFVGPPAYFIYDGLLHLAGKLSHLFAFIQ